MNRLERVEAEKRATELLAKELNIEKEVALQRSGSKLNFPHQMRGRFYQEWLKRFSEEDAQSANDQLQTLRSGNFSVMPLVCKGVKECPHGHVCPFTANMPPLGAQCPMEQTIILDRMEALMKEYQVDGHRYTDFIILNRIVELELLDMRVSSVLSSERYQGITQIAVTGSTPQGDLIENEIANPLFALKEKISREKVRLLDVIVGTREAKYKREAALKQKDMTTFNDAINQLVMEVHRLERKLEG
jgi:hypothetical protein